MAFQDQTLKCRDCGADFTWTAGEQEFYQQKGFTNAPTRCVECRKQKRQERMATRKMHPITCANCGKEDQVPFRPKGDRPVLCKDCFAKQRAEGAPASQTPVTEAPNAEVTADDVKVPEVTVEQAPQEQVLTEGAAGEVPMSKPKGRKPKSA
jgi:CxxC-x17-CxxC domain-containing protein